MNEVATRAPTDAPRLGGVAAALRRPFKDAWFTLGVAACTAAVGVFLIAKLTAWPPHEDETLALFVGRKDFIGLFRTVLGERGGAPLHFLLAWIVAHTGGGLTELRLVSAIFATASVPVVAALGARLAPKSAALGAAAIVAGSWMLLFHGIYGRMYSLFLFTSALSYLALLHAAKVGGRRGWTPWVVAILFCVAGHPYGALVLASQGVYVLLSRARVRQAVVAFGAVAVLGVPFWITDLVLAGRFDVGVGGGGEKLGSVGAVLGYLFDVVRDFTAGWIVVDWLVLVAAAVGLVSLAVTRFRSALLILCVFVTPTVALVGAKLGSSTAPASRHLIFALPFFALLVAVGIQRAARLVPRHGGLAAGLLVAALIPAEVAWGWHKTPELYRGEKPVRVRARDEAARWLAQSSRPDDVLLGYDPLNLQAWEDGGRISQLVVPRADAKLALRTLRRAHKPLGRGVWILDKSDTSSYDRELSVRPSFWRGYLPERFEIRVFGPFVIYRSREPAGTIRNYLKLARDVQMTGEGGIGLGLGDSDVNLATVEQGGLAHAKRQRRDGDWPYPPLAERK